MEQEKKNIGKQTKKGKNSVTEPVPTLFSQESKEKQQEKTEELRMKRKKQIAILKAQNEMLESARKQVEERYADDEYSLMKVKKEIDAAIQENKDSGMQYLQATPEEIDAAEYHGPSKYWEEKYKERLKAKGMSDDELRQKDIAVAVAHSSEKEVADKVKNSEVKNVENKDKPSVSVLAKPMTPDIPVINKPADGYKPFDPKSIPDYVQYDVLPLPSKGQCYPHKKSIVPVAYLTASDENMIVAPNLYRDGKITDVILKRKILDPDFDVDTMCQGDKDAIVLWLRANAYGDEFPITTKNPNNGKTYNLTLNLSEILSKYKDFDLVGDENGYFDYVLTNGNVIKFRIVSGKEYSELRNRIEDKMKVGVKLQSYRMVKELSELTKSFGSDDWSDIVVQIGELYKAMESKNVYSEIDENDLYGNTITDEMILATVAVNGNTDREYIRNYIENMRAGDARAFRLFVNQNQPGVDLSITVNIPESDGGGSYDTFLRLDEYVFLNV